MIDTPDRRQLLDVEPAKEASEAALRLLNADKTGKPFNFSEGDSPLFQIVVNDIRADLERLLVPQKADFDRAIQSNNVELFIDLLNRLLTHFSGVKLQLSREVCCLFQEERFKKGLGKDSNLIYSFRIDEKSQSTLRVGISDGQLTSLSLVARIGLTEKFPGIEDRYLIWKTQQGVEKCSTQGAERCFT